MALPLLREALREPKELPESLARAIGPAEVRSLAAAVGPGSYPPLPRWPLPPSSTPPGGSAAASPHAAGTA